MERRAARAAALLAWVLLLAWSFANVEVQIEGPHGWASALPTWRIEKHWLLELFWGGRPLTGYHAWVFSFMALAFHLPLVLTGSFTRKLEARCVGSLMVFWIAEDFLWFVLNPAYGTARFRPGQVPWHVHWALGLPVDYLVFCGAGALLLWYSFRSEPPAARLGLEDRGVNSEQAQ